MHFKRNRVARTRLQVKTKTKKVKIKDCSYETCGKQILFETLRAKTKKRKTK
jgi:hypothetical protein